MQVDTPAAVAASVTRWHASLELREDPGGEATATLRAEGDSEQAARAALAEVLHERVFCAAIAAETAQNFNNYDSPLSFLESIRAEHEAVEAGESADSYAANLIWDALWEALCTLRVRRGG